MSQPNDPHETVANEPVRDRAIDVPTFPAVSLDIGQAATLGSAAPPPGPGLEPTVMLGEVEGENRIVVKTESDAIPTRDESGGRYRLDGEIARGGMGVVLRGRDVDLGRDLAIKVLLEKYADRPDMSRRFVEEAQIGGQLQHPGVVPVYDIGKFGDRPYFTMKLVKGQTLAAILGERAEAATDRPRLLSIALQVAQAVGYAHARGVIHRDLKPANIMVGAFGEVQVMDWGLAKVMAEGGGADEKRTPLLRRDPDETTIRTARSTDPSGVHGTETEAGSILGTPAYMPPEQASGDIAHLDRRADVFALGAILCEILTGKPPYLGRSGEEVRRKAANGDLADAAARLNSCEADPELVALTKACLAPEAVDRPADAQAVVDALASHLDGMQERLKQAERDRAVAVVREAEQRKRRRVQLALAAAVMGLVLGGGSFASWQAGQANRRREADLRRQLADEQRTAADAARIARNAEAVSGLLGQAEEALRSDDADKAAVALGAAKRRSTEGGAEKEAGRLVRLVDDLALLGELDAVDRFRWAWTEDGFPDPAAVTTRTREALEHSGADPDATSPGEAAARASASAVRERIVSALDRLLRYRQAAGVRALLRRLDADPYRDAVRDAILAGDETKMAGLGGQSAALDQPPGFVAFLGESGALPAERRRQLLEMAAIRRPGDLGVLMTLGNSYPINREEGADERLRWYQAAVAAAPANTSALNNLGVTLKDKGRMDEAIACYRKAIELDPKPANFHNNLAVALKGKGQVDEAIACCRQAIRLDPKHALAYNSLAVVLTDKGLQDDAIGACKKAIEIDPKYANAYINMGNALKAKGLTGEAIACYGKAGEISPNSAAAFFNLGVALQAQARQEEAIASYRKVIEIDPKYAEAHCNLGFALASQGRFAESLASLIRGHELGSGRPGWRYPSGEWVRQGEARSAIEAKLPALLKGDWRPVDNSERLTLAETCRSKKLSRTATGLYAAAFAADPKLADDPWAQHRYHAACQAALASAGRGEDAAGLDDEARARLREQALDWLRADLAERTRQVRSAAPADLAAAQQDLRHRQRDEALAPVRDADALSSLPEAEREVWRAIWVEVQSLLERAEGEALIAGGSTLDAIPHLASAWEGDPGDGLLLLKVAALQAWFRRDADLAATCRKARDHARGTRLPQVAERTAKSSSLQPSDDRAGRDATLALARLAVDLGKDEDSIDWYRMALGIAQYRAGDHSAAAETLQAQAASSLPEISVTSAIYLAMSLSRQGDEAGARRVATGAISRMKPPPPDENNPLAGGASHDDLILWLACKEARALLKLDAAPAGPGGK